MLVRSDMMACLQPEAASQPAHTTVLRARWLGQRPYRTVWREMRAFTDGRSPGSEDEVWFLEHPPVFTIGLAGRCEHLLDCGEVEAIHSDRGGQATYHGPGQLLAYLLLDLRRRGLAVGRYVSLLEEAVIGLLAEWGLKAKRRPGAPGVYVPAGKVVSIGIRVRRGCSFHGLALNVNMDLEPFRRIEPCGVPGLPVTQLAELGVGLSVIEVAELLLPRLCTALDSRPRWVRWAPGDAAAD